MRYINTLSTKCIALGALVSSSATLLPATASAQQPVEATGDGDGEAVKVFPLTNTSSRNLLDILDTMFGDEAAGLASDERTNTVVVKAKPDVLRALEAVLFQLDRQSPRPDEIRPELPLRPEPPTAAPASPSRPARDALRIISEVRGVTQIRSIVEHGAAVRKGDLLVELDDSLLTDEANKLLIEAAEIKSGEIPQVRQRLADADTKDVSVFEAGLHLAILRRNHVKAELQLELMTAQRKIDLAKLAVMVAKARKESGPGGGVADAEDAGLELAKAEAEVEMATAEKKLLEDHTQPLRIAEVQLEELRATTELNQASTRQKLAREQVKAEQHALEERLKLNFSRMNRIEQLRVECKIHAPSDGVVRYPAEDVSNMVAIGRQVREGQTILLLYLVD